MRILLHSNSVPSRFKRQDSNRIVLPATFPFAIVAFCVSPGNILSRRTGSLKRDLIWIKQGRR